ncbi:uncharacterized protein LOC124436497 [Xenia sp. Carnegie-2017]|uniref:uncharacterized protein LOC124436497 n=1 Tax=Xenia sp. Carnegie-2017 TaxID=2897299 RepID=UPI001F0460AF|nr:uncharacterized protein LOC124436497 [Xenia sp. Carnegie-2017]
MLSRANACLVKFATDMEKLYGLTNCTFNVHVMTHLAEGVRNCGPLWATSAFAFEANNHFLLKMFNGTQYVPQQICDTFILSQKLPGIGKECIRDDACPRVRHLFNKLSKDKIPTNSERALTRAVTGLGNGQAVRLTPSETISVAKMINRDVANRSATLYNRFIVNHVLYTSESYTRSQRHHDYYVQIDSSTTKYGIVVGLYRVQPDCQCSTAELQACQCEVYYVVIVKKLDLCGGRPLFSNKECGVTSHFVRECTNRDQIVALKPDQIKDKGVHLKLRNRDFFFELPCKFYGD